MHDDAATPAIEVQLDSDASHHIVRVLRSRKGASVVLFDGHGGEHRAVLSQVDKRRVTALVESFDPIDRESSLHVTLALGLSRGERMDFALQKATELGASALVPITTARSVVRLDSERAERRHSHWRQVIVSACEQSGRTRIPRLASPQSFSEWLDEDLLAPIRLVLDPQAPPLTAVCDEASEVLVAVGPEGGFDASELEQLSRRGFQRITLGPRVLRTETAAAAAVLFAQLRWGAMGRALAAPRPV